MKTKINGASKNETVSTRLDFVHILKSLLFCVTLTAVVGCGSTSEKKSDGGFFTSGSREADQRASQRIARDEQLAGSGEKNVKKNDGDPVLSEKKISLYERLGGEPGLTKIVDDFMPRALQDPRVNWERKGVKRGGFSFSRNQPQTWSSNPATIARLKKHFVQFFALATGGPARYEGKEMKTSHANMRITNAEFDATVGDLKASLDKLQIADREQKELLAIVESTRPQIVSER